ncbi:TPA: bifunctional UDP-sugar hydrolase/5'-nucleotidase [Streptococcus agalactiae]
MTELIRILHLNDLHSHFENFPKVKRFFHDNQAQPIETISLDLGDNIDKSHPLTEASSGKANVQLMNELGIELATIGNNEGVGLSKKDLDQVYKDSDFTVIVGNLKDNIIEPSWVKPYIIYETQQGTKLAFLAYTFPYYKTYEPNGWTIEDPIDCLKCHLQINEIKEANCRILMSHLGIRFDTRIAQEFSEIDLIIGAHTHHLFEEGELITGTYLAAAGKYGRFVGSIDITFDNHTLKDILISTYDTKQLTGYPSDSDWAKEIESEGKEQLRKESLISFPAPLSLEESCQLVMDAMLFYAGADVAIINSGLIVQPFEKDFSRKNLHESLPHQMRLAKLTVSSQELLEIYETIYQQGQFLAQQKIHGMGFRGKYFGEVLHSGFDYKNGKIVYNEKDIDAKEEVILVIVDQYYFASYFECLKTKKVDLLFPELLRDVVADYLINMTL